jgi:putative protease
MHARAAMRHRPVIVLELPVPNPPQTLPELLAPAGGPAALRAAIANGADAVYLGVEEFNARRGAQNFTLDGLPETCRFAHLRGVRVYLTVNVVVLPDELGRALSLVDRAWAAGVDAVIVQDQGLLRGIRLAMPDVRVHASTQMNAHNTPTIHALGALGVSRVTLAREVRVEEIASFVAAGGPEIESFVHGALCICYSGQCLLSSLIGRRSANRGMCAQPCRLPYELLARSGEALATPGVHLLSPKDLAGIALLPSLVSTGVAALKIEGRMKSPEYVALVTGVYRAALDRARWDPEAFSVRDAERSILAESFSRGFSEAYLVGERGNEMMSYSRPNNRGVLVGRVARVAGSVAAVALESAIESEDTIEFWTSTGRFAQPVGRITLEGKPHDAAPAGRTVELQIEQPVASGDRVFRVRNAALTAAAARTFADDGRIRATKLDFDVAVVIGQPLSLTVRDTEGRTGSATGPTVEAARTKELTAEEVAEHVERLGGTPYAVGRWSLELSPGAGLGFSALHKGRREAIEAYEDAVLAPYSGRRARRPWLPSLSPPRHRKRSAPTLCVRVSQEGIARACLDAGADVAYVDALALSGSSALPAGIVPALPRICHDAEFAAAMRWSRQGTPVLAGNLGLLVESAAAGAAVEADWCLNATNGYAIAALAEKGAGLVWLSPELSGAQISEVTVASSVDAGLTVYGRQELMVTEHCVLMSAGECDRHCGTCERRAAGHMLRDRKGYLFPVVTDVLGRTHLFNSVRLDLSAVLGDIIGAGVSSVRLDLELETVEAARSAVERFRSLLENGGAPASGPARREADTTTGHYFRGVL